MKLGAAVVWVLEGYVSWSYYPDSYVKWDDYPMMESQTVWWVFVEIQGYYTWGPFYTTIKGLGTKSEHRGTSEVCFSDWISRHDSLDGAIENAINIGVEIANMGFEVDVSQANHCDKKEEIDWLSNRPWSRILWRAEKKLNYKLLKAQSNHN